MGIPSFFQTLLKKNQSLFTADRPAQCQRLYLDYNCLVHYVLQKSQPTDHESFICEVLNYTHHVVKEVVRPSQFVMIALDGPVPNTKLVKQRERRFKKAFDKQFLHQDDQDHDPPVDSNTITPGTVFMQKLQERIKHVVLLRAFDPLVVEFSDSNEAGEGEWKIFQHLRYYPCPASQCCIYGLDADLIILTLANSYTDATICREHESGNLHFLHVSDVFSAWLHDQGLIFKYQLNPTLFLQDFVLLFMFGGNDFVPAFEFTRIRDGGWKWLIHAYRSFYQHAPADAWLTRLDGGSPSIHWDSLYTYLTGLAASEYVVLRKKHQKLFHQKHSHSHTEQANAHNNEIYLHEPFVQPIHPFHAQYMQQLHQINFCKPVSIWRPLYYNHLLSVPYEPNSIRYVCSDYLDTLLWCWNYYMFGTIPSWSYKYAYSVAPCLHDFVTCFFDIQCMFRSFQCDALQGTPLSPLAQLLCVLPRTSHSLLPPCLQSEALSPDSPLHAQYPFNELCLDLDLLTGYKMIYTSPYLPSYDLQRLQWVCNSKLSELSAQEHDRNTILFFQPKCIPPPPPE